MYDPVSYFLTGVYNYDDPVTFVKSTAVVSFQIKNAFIRSSVVIQEPQGRRERKALRAREAMFDAALQAFDARPIASVSVLDVTEAADVAKGVFYLHFRSKDSFVLALWARTEQHFHTMLQERVTANQSQSARVDALIEGHLEALHNAPSETRFILRVRGLLPGDLKSDDDTVVSMRAKHLEAFTGLVYGVDNVNESTTRRAAVIDAALWGAIDQVVQHGDSSIDRPALRAALIQALRSRSN